MKKNAGFSFSAKQNIIWLFIQAVLLIDLNRFFRKKNSTVATLGFGSVTDCKIGL
ncbi:hypothetical protein [Lactobacillus johnsonii]|uniref:hypothetical protein n=1 Tax=Lactobacillus johnsonii TaxID=33959 RepID=UPI003BF60804